MYTITLIPGDGIGPEVVMTTQKIIEAAGIPIQWDVQEAGFEVYRKEGTPLPTRVLDSIRKNKVALKGPTTTPIAEGFRSINVTIRQELDLFANVRQIKNYPNIPSKYQDIDMVIIRENTEDLYAGIEHMVGEDAAESIKIFTRRGCQRIIRYAFEFARKANRKKVTCVHKANIMKCTDGMFLRIARDISKEYNEIDFEDIIVDAMCMKLVQHPENYDVLVLPNLYGDIISDLAAGLIGGLGVAPGANLGNELAVFEAVHGSAPDIAGLNIANPTAIILSTVHMLKHIGEVNSASSIEKALSRVLKEGKFLTRDIGGKASTTEFMHRIISMLG